MIVIFPSDYENFVDGVVAGFIPTWKTQQGESP